MGDAFTPINTQEEFDARIKDRLERERSKYKDYEELKKNAETYSTEKAGYEKAIAEHKAKAADYEKQIGELSTKTKKYETDSAKTRIALETGLPYAMAARLSGDTEDAIRSDAKALAELIGKSNTPPPPLKSTESKGGDDGYKQLLEQLNTKQ